MSEEFEEPAARRPVHVSAPVTVAVPVTSAQVSEPVLAISDPQPVLSLLPNLLHKMEY